MKQHFFYIGIGILTLIWIHFLGIEKASAAKLSLDSKTTVFVKQQSYQLDIHVNSEEEIINAVEGRVHVPEGLGVKEMRDGTSVVQYWVKRPSILSGCENGCDIFFSGIMPGGFSGSKGLVFSIIISPPPETSQINGQMTFHDVKVLLHDGLGTPTDVSTTNLTYAVTTDPDASSPDAITPDTTPPEPFSLSLLRDPELFAGQWFIIFTAVDRESGIDHYEICEHPREGNHVKECLDQWLIAESPYQLKDQTLNGVVTVKATDRRGNVRVASIRLGLLSNYEKYLKWIILGIGGGLAIAMTRGKVWSKLKSHRE